MKIAIDVGSGLTKWRTSKAFGRFPSAAGHCPLNSSGFSVTDFSADVVEINGKPHSYLVGESADLLLEDGEREATLTKNWPNTTEYRALLYKSIADAAPKGLKGEISLCIGLPQKYFEELKPRILEKLAGEHVFQVDGAKYAIKVPKEQTFVIPQSMSIFFQYAFNEPESAHEDMICVIDVGTFTTGYSLVNAGRFNPRKSGGLELGISDLRNELSAYLKRKHDLSLPAQTVTKALVRGRVRVGKKTVQLTNVIPSIADPLMDRLVEELTKVWGDDASTAIVLLAGGGAPHVVESIKRKWPHAELLAHGDDCARVIVDGYYGYLESRLGS